MTGFNYRKAVQLLIFFGNKMNEVGETPNKLKAIKLIWLSDRYLLRHYARTITRDKYFAMPLGPVPSNTYDLFKKVSLATPAKVNFDNNIKSLNKYSYRVTGNFNPDVFSKVERNIINELWNAYGHMPAQALSILSHKFPEWKRYEERLNKNHCKAYPMELEDFFINVEDSTGLFVTDQELLDISKELTFA